MWPIVVGIDDVNPHSVPGLPCVICGVRAEEGMFLVREHRVTRIGRLQARQGDLSDGSPEVRTADADLEWDPGLTLCAPRPQQARGSNSSKECLCRAHRAPT